MTMPMAHPSDISMCTKTLKVLRCLKARFARDAWSREIYTKEDVACRKKSKGNCDKCEFSLQAAGRAMQRQLLGNALALWFTLLLIPIALQLISDVIRHGKR